MVVAFLAAAYSQLRVHVLGRDQIIARALATNRFTVSRVDKARRGAIFTADGKPLAQDEETYEFGVNFKKVPHSQSFFVELGAAADVPASDLAQLAASGAGNRVWKDLVPSRKAQEIRRVKREWRADGVSLAPTGRRVYPFGEAAAGFVGLVRGGEALGGLELSQNKPLSGRDGLRVGLVDREGAYLPLRLESETRERLDGLAVTTTVDSSLQQVAAASIKAAVEKNAADNGVAIVMDPATGDILAMANWPSFDPSAAQRAVGRNLKAADYNPNYMGSFEPGSTFKILTLAKALSEGVAGTADTFHCTGEMSMGKAKPVRCDLHHGTRAHGTMDLTRVIAKSCNIASARWSMAIGYDGMLQYLRDLGLLSKTSMGLPFEKAGQFNLAEWDKRRQIADVGFGQSLNATPAALVSAFGMLANGGVRMEPRLIKRIGETDHPVREAGRIVSELAADELLKYMEAVIETDAGTGKSLRIPGYRLGGKTGTAQRIGHSGHVSNFVGFVPAQDPKAVILVMVNNPKMGAYYGALVAGPVFVDVARAVIRRYAIPPTETVQ